MKLETRAALRDRQNKIDAHVSRLGQEEARRYLAKDCVPQVPINLLTFMAGVYVVAVATFAYLLG